MANITLNCTVSLSNKLQGLIGGGSQRLTLHINDMFDGKGIGKLVISNELDEIGSIEMGKETSIMLTPLSVSEDYAAAQEPVTNIFSNENIAKDSADIAAHRTPVDRLAATEPPESRSQVSRSVVQPEEVQTPPAFSELDQPEVRKFVTSLNELLTSASEASNKEYDVDIDSINDKRQRALALEKKELAESIDADAYIVNDSCASLSINDLELSLMLNVPYNLGNVSAKRVSNSADLKGMLKQGLVKFIEPKECEQYFRKAGQDPFQVGLDTYSSADEAERAIESTVPSADQMDISVGEIDDMEEQAILATNLTPMNIDQSGVRTSSHGGAMKERKIISNDSTVNKSGLKTISRYKS